MSLDRLHKRRLIMLLAVGAAAGAAAGAPEPGAAAELPAREAEIAAEEIRAALTIQAYFRGNKVRNDKKLVEIRKTTDCPIRSTTLRFQTTYITPCNHVFNSRALLHWLTVSPYKTCPSCRYIVDEIAVILDVIRNPETPVVKEEALGTLLNLAGQVTSEDGIEAIAGAIANIASTEEGISALIANGNVIPTLTTLAGQVTSEDGRAEIARAIASIASKEEGISALIANGNVIPTLTTLAGQVTSEDGRARIARAIENIARTEEGISALRGCVKSNK